jgi:DNA-binding FadR family transcriptional regulator
MAKDRMETLPEDSRPFLDGSVTRQRNLKTSELVARELATYIVDSGLTEGTTLPTERNMAESLGVGRTTMREALRLLETRGVLTIRPGPGGGPVVRRPRPADLSEALTLMLQFDSATFEEVMAARGSLEPVVARLAAVNIDDAAVQQLKVANEAIAAGSDDVSAMVGNKRFHEIIAESCGNLPLRIFTATLIQIGDGRSVGVTYGPKHILGIVGAHQLIIEALESRDAEAAETAMRSHLTEAATYWRKKFPDSISRAVRWTA